MLAQVASGSPIVAGWSKVLRASSSPLASHRNRWHCGVLRVPTPHYQKSRNLATQVFIFYRKNENMLSYFYRKPYSDSSVFGLQVSPNQGSEGSDRTPGSNMQVRTPPCGRPRRRPSTRTRARSRTGTHARPPRSGWSVVALRFPLNPWPFLIELLLMLLLHFGPFPFSPSPPF